MNVTNDRFKDRQLHIEDYLQMVSTELKEYAEVSACQRITENNRIITDVQTDGLLEKILQPTNLNHAYKKVKSNKGAGGVDGMSVDELLPFLRDNQVQLIQQLKDGKYRPNPVRRVEIPKETKGEFENWECRQWLTGYSSRQLHRCFPRYMRNSFQKTVLAFDQREVRMTH